jgi:hypothetical protein
LLFLQQPVICKIEILVINQRTKIQISTRIATSVGLAVYLYWLLKLKELSTKLTRWVLRLFKFQYTEEHQPRQCHVVPDVISWHIAAL